MSIPIYAVYGASGFGREVMPVAREALKAQGIDIVRLVFVDDAPELSHANGHEVMRYEEFMALPASERYAVIAVASSSVREQLAARLLADGINPWAVQATNVVSMDGVKLGEGSLLCPFVTMTSNIRIGKYFHANIYSYVAHDCVIGDFVTFAPGVMCNGNVVIEDHAYIGTGAVIKQGSPGAPLVIGRGAVVGMGAVVTKSVPAGATVVGNPARILSK